MYIDSSPDALIRREGIQDLVAISDQPQLGLSSYRIFGDNDAQHTMDIALTLFPEAINNKIKRAECYVYQAGLTIGQVLTMMNNSLRFKLPKTVMQHQDLWTSLPDGYSEAVAQNTLPVLAGAGAPEAICIYGNEVDLQGYRTLQENTLILHPSGLQTKTVWDTLKTAQRMQAFNIVAPKDFIAEA